MPLQKCLSIFLILASICLVSISTFANTDQPLRQAQDKPNVIIIITDDHGWSDISAQGILDDVKTPHTDKIAASGVLFTSGYSSAPQCRPARAGLMAGRNQSCFGEYHRRAEQKPRNIFVKEHTLIFVSKGRLLMKNAEENSLNEQIDLLLTYFAEPVRARFDRVSSL